MNLLLETYFSVIIVTSELIFKVLVDAPHQSDRTSLESLETQLKLQKFGMPPCLTGNHKAVMSLVVTSV